MKSLNARLDELTQVIQTSDFLEGKGLSNEVNIRFFCYDPKDEMAVREHVVKMKENKKFGCRLVERNLYEIFLLICEKLEIMNQIEEMEREEGSQNLLDQLRSTVEIEDFAVEIDNFERSPKDVLLLTGVGDVFPFMRVHSLLEALQPRFSDTPILVMYPGEFTGTEMKLFNLLESNNYYRAFKLL